MPRSPSMGQVVTITPAPGIVTVIERFDVTADRQEKARHAAQAHIEGVFASEPGFVAAVLLRSRSGSGLSCYAQWDRSPGEDEPGAPSRSLAPALPTHLVVDSRTYSVEFSAHPAFVAPPTLASMERTPFAHFGIFTVTRENQNRMVDRARANAPKALGTPGLMAINFHRSLDSLRVVNLGLWFSLDDFDASIQRPGFRDDDLYWEGVADFQPDFFDVVAITTAQVGV